MRTLVGRPGYQRFWALGLKLIPSSTSCTVANGQSCSVIGYIQAPIKLKDKTRPVDVLVVPDLSHFCILGIDFLISIDLIPNLLKRVWHFGDGNMQTVECIQDESALTLDQQVRLK